MKRGHIDCIKLCLIIVFCIRSGFIIFYHVCLHTIACVTDTGMFETEMPPEMTPSQVINRISK